MRRAAVPCLWPALWGLTLIASGSGAQGLHRAAFAASATVGGQSPSYAPLSAPDLLGLGVSVEALVQQALTARVAVTALRSVSIRDDLSVCIAPEPPWDLYTNCFEPNYAAWYGVVSGDLLWRPHRSGPLYGLAGGGWSLVSSRPYVWSVPPMAGLPRGSALWRVGVGLVLGRSPRAPRLELATSQFATRVGTAKRVHTLQLWLR